MKQLTAIIIGAGGRGSTFSTHMKNMSDKFKVVGVADPVWEKCRFVRDQHGFGDDMCFPDWKDILARPNLIQGVKQIDGNRNIGKRYGNGIPAFYAVFLEVSRHFVNAFDKGIVRDRAPGKPKGGKPLSAVFLQRFV